MSFRLALGHYLSACIFAALQVHKVALGSPQQEGYTCLLPRPASAAAAITADATGNSSSSSSDGGGGSMGAAGAAAASTTVGRAAAAAAAKAAAAAVAVDVEVQRGYGAAAVHAMPAEACQLMARRSAGAWVLPEGERVAAIKVAGERSLPWRGAVLVMLACSVQPLLPASPHTF